MDDRCATNTAIHRQLEAAKGSSINDFKCGMHPLDTIAKDCDKVLCNFEKQCGLPEKKKAGQYPFTHRGESDTQALVCTSSKIFHEGQYACGKEFIEHVKTAGIAACEKDTGKSVIYYRFVGNRFHILFLLCGLLYHYRKKIKSYFTTIAAPKNAVQNSVLNCLNISDFDITLKAMGILSKSLTGPWMRMLADKTILELNPIFQEIRSKLALWAEDASPLLEGNLPSAVPDVDVLRDAVYMSLIEPSSDIMQTQTLLQDLCRACLAVVDRQLVSQLSGGKFSTPTPELANQARSCSATNISGERIFALSDHIMARARNAQISHVESKVMFKANKTMDWLMKDDPSKQQHCFLAIKGAQAISKEDKRRREETRERINQNLLSSRKLLLAKED